MGKTHDLRKINYEGDDLKLTKDQILNICKQVENYWSKDPVGNVRRLVSLKIFRTGILFTSSKDVEDIWRIMLKFIDELRYQNFIAGHDQGADILGSVKKSIASEIFG